MNTLVLLVAATCTPGADPLPAVETRPSAGPTYINPGVQEWSGPPQESRPRFFARLRGLFSRKSQTMDAAPPDLSGYSQGAIRNGAVNAPNSIVYPNASTGKTNSSIFRPQPAYAPPSSPELQRMPTGQPF